MSILEEAEAIAKMLIKHAPDIREALEIARDLKVRAGRDAEVGDLDDSIDKLKALDRREG